jgi:hypothetical protein
VFSALRFYSDDPHVVLGVEKSAAPHEIKTAWKKLIIKHHPDKGGNPVIYARIQAAYEVDFNFFHICLYFSEAYWNWWFEKCFDLL